ncbi:hypothetical protein C455_04071 [Haloferax larsenii JCM 13917]|nr:hypothetical protein [Haloferax larsenii]ELZ81337.1 hypothetical protein C455_04071 [Haloferax larsenii JCM 13917]
MREGVLYIASGSKFIEEAITSAQSVKSNTDLPVTLVTDREVTESCFDTVIQGDEFCYHYGDSVLQIPDLPYDRTLLLDTDTKVHGDLSDLFEITDCFDIAASTIADGEFTLSSRVPEPFPEYNTGVVLFKNNPQVVDFINEWKDVYRTYLDGGVRMNQPAFREVLYKSSLRIATIPTEYNCRANFGGYLNNRVKILHGDFEDYDEVISKLNEFETPRLFYNRNGDIQVKRVETVNSNQM